MKYILLFIIGIVELFLGIIDFKLTQKNRIGLSTTSTYIGVIIWYLILRTMVEFIDDFILANIYAMGCALGCYLGMRCEPYIDNFIKIQRRGRKLRRGKKRKKR